MRTEPTQAEREAAKRAALEAAVSAQEQRDQAAGLESSGPVSSQARINIWTEPYTPAHNRAILACPSSLLGGGLPSQRLFLLKMALDPMPCPSCGRMNTKVDASGVGLDGYHVDGPEREDYRCTGCHRPLLYGLPFVGAPFWHIDHAREAREKNAGAALDRDATAAGTTPRYVQRPAADAE